MNFTKESKIAGIITRSLTEELDPAGRAELDRWLSRAEANRELYDRIASGDSFAEDYILRSLFSDREPVRVINGKISRRRAGMISLVSVPAAAAVLALFLLFPFNPGPETGSGQPDRLAVTDLNPAGTHKATLSYGENDILLTDGEEGAGWEKYIDDQAPGASVPQPEQVTISIPRQGEYQVRLPDGTMVWLNSESSITYPSRFDGNERRVAITGEAFFEVATDTAKPFLVDFLDTRIRVTGTSFNISAYANDPAATATLVSGSVELIREDQIVELAPGRQAVIEYHSGEVHVRNVDPSIYSAWKNGTFIFENTTLSEICQRLERWYDVQFEFEGMAGFEKFTGGTWKYLPLVDFLEGIKLVTDIKFDIKEGKVKIYN